MKDWVQPAALAVRFLSRVSLPGEEMDRFARDLPRALAFFPLAGAALGACSALVLLAAAQALPLYLAVLLALAFDAWLGRGLHEDAVADFADGLGGGRTPEEVLRIMKDSRVGAFGVLALGFAVALRGAGLVALEEAWRAALVLVVGGATARLLMLAVLAASASYIVVPAVVRAAIPEANPGIYFSMSLAMTFPFNVIIGIPLYHSVIAYLWR